MRRRIFIAFLCLLLMCPVFAAADDKGQFCFDAIPFFDKLTASLDLREGETFLGLLTVQWRAANLYQLGGAGAVLESHPVEGSYAVNLLLTNDTAFFGGNHLCALRAQLTTGTLFGPWRLTCTGAAPPPPPAVAPPPFQVSGTLVPVDCAPPVVALRQEPDERSMEEKLDALWGQGVYAAGDARSNELVQP